MPAEAGQLTRRVTFQVQGGDGDSPGGFYDVVTRDARIQPLKGGEAVQADRMAGSQPVIIYVRRDSVTKRIDNSYRAYDARDATIVWDVQSTLVTEDLNWVEVLATDRLGDNA
jgi:head-tail adaptor